MIRLWKAGGIFVLPDFACASQSVHKDAAQISLVVHSIFLCAWE